MFPSPRKAPGSEVAQHKLFIPLDVAENAIGLDAILVADDELHHLVHAFIGQVVGL
jgi:hypothetical protein